MRHRNNDHDYMKADLIRLLLLGLWVGLGFVPGYGEQQAPVAVSSVTFTEGRIWVPGGGKEVLTTNEVSVAGNVVVATNGVFRVAEGKERQLRAGRRSGRAVGLWPHRYGRSTPTRRPAV